MIRLEESDKSALDPTEADERMHLMNVAPNVGFVFERAR